MVCQPIAPISALFMSVAMCVCKFIVKGNKLIIHHEGQIPNISEGKIGCIYMQRSPVCRNYTAHLQTQNLLLYFPYWFVCQI